MNYRWQIGRPDAAKVNLLEKELGVTGLLADCLVNRGFHDPAVTRQFLNPRLKDLADPMLVPNMQALVERLWHAGEGGENIVIFGDYDVDGVTAAAILLEVFRHLGWEHTQAYLPHRREEGYGLSRSGVENCLARYPSRLLLAVDCGSTSTSTIAWLRENDIEVLVLDHHQVSDPPPPANIIVNPQLGAPSGGPFQELCSAGLAFKLAHALLKHGRQAGFEAAWHFDLKSMLDLVALGTIADLVPLIGENRILVAKGLENLSRTKRPGLRALKEVAQINGSVGVFEVGFQLGPRLNAAGRLENAVDALDLLLQQDEEDASLVAHHLDIQNRERQRIERIISDSAVQAVHSKFNAQCDFVLVESNPDWHIGVIGIVASRVMREFYRPTIIIGHESGEWRGSARSIPGFDLAAALRQCDDLLLRHGGHAMAAGLSIVPENIEPLRERLNEIARNSLNSEMLRPVLDLDAEVSLAQISLPTVEELSLLQPSGQANPKVQLVVRGLQNLRPPRRLGRDQQHLKLWTTDGRHTVEAIWWACGSLPVPQGRFDLAFEPQINEFNGKRSVLMKLLDWQPSA